MSIFLSLLLLFFTAPVSPSSSPDRYTKSLPSNHKPREYLELTRPLPSDFLVPSRSKQILRHSFADTINAAPFSTRYSPLSDCLSPWSHVALKFRAESRGEQYDHTGPAQGLGKLGLGLRPHQKKKKKILRKKRPHFS